jgi:hypothetical protein
MNKCSAKFESKVGSKVVLYVYPRGREVLSMEPVCVTF